MANANTPAPFQTGYQIPDGGQLNAQLSNPVESTQQSVTATGTNRATAFAVTASVTNFTTVAASTGAVLPLGNPGKSFTLFNNGASAMTVYFTGSDTCDGVAGATGVTLSNGSRCQYYCVASGVWLSAKLGATSS